MSYSDSFPSVSPSWQCNFASNGGRLDPRITFSRSDTPPTYAAPSAVHYWSNEKHLSSENLLLDSKTGTANWTEAASGSAATPTITANHAASPDGTASQATRVQLNLNGATDTSSNSRYNQAIILPSGDSVTFSVWLKSTDGVSSYAIQVYQADGSSAAATVTGSWQKFTTTATAAGSAAFGIRLRGGQSPTNADTADVLMWGANVSTTGQTVLSETTTQIHREYAPTLKSVSTAGQPRFEYSPTDSASEAIGQSRGLLIEGQVTNVLPFSTNGYNASNAFVWSSNNIGATENAAVAPSGNLEATLIREDGTTNQHNFYRTITGTAAKYTYSIYVKDAGVGTIGFRLLGPTSYGLAFNLSDGSTSAFYNAVEDSGFEDVGNGWKRIWVTQTLTAAAWNMMIYLARGGVNYAGDKYSGVLWYGAQIEQSSFPSSYTDTGTSGSTVTRAADSASLAMSSAGVSQGPVSVVVEGSAGSGNGPYLVSLSDGTGANRSSLSRDSTTADTTTNYRFYVRTDNSAVASLLLFDSASAAKFAMRIDTDDFAACAGGGTVVTDTAGVAPVTTTIHIATAYNGVYQANGHVKRIALYGEALSDTNLQALTS